MSVKLTDKTAEFLWEVIRRNKNFLDEYEQLFSNDKGEKIADPNFCWKWCIKYLYHPSKSIAEIKNSFKCKKMYKKKFPIFLSMIIGNSSRCLEKN